MLHAFRRGTRRASPVALSILVAVLSLIPRRIVAPRQSVASRRAAFARDPRARHPVVRRLEAISAFTSVTARRLAHHPKMALSMDSQSSVTFPLAIQATGLLTFALAGFTTPLNTPAFLWTYGSPALLRVPEVCRALSRRCAPSGLLLARPVFGDGLCSTDPIARVSATSKPAWAPCAASCTTWASGDA